MTTMPIRNSCSISDSLASDARWIWPPNVAGPNSYVEFQCLLDLTSLPHTAYLQLSAETSLRLYVNGRFFHAGPPREVPPYFYFDTLDLRPALVAGRNELRIIAHHQGRDSASYQAGTPAILVAGECAADGRVVRFSDPALWQSRRLTRYLADAHRLFTCIGFSEHSDFSAPDAPWQPAVEVAAHPWSERPTALARDLPFFTSTNRHPVSLVPYAGGWLADFGGEVFGHVVLRARTPRKLSLRIAYAEALANGRVAPEKGGMNYTDLLELPPSETQWHSYEKRACRFMHLSEPVDVLDLHIIEHLYPYVRCDNSPAPASLSSESQLIRQIHDISARTIALNTDDLLTDCPWRERAQYFDSLFYMGAMHRLFGTLAPVRRFLHQFPRGADTSGLLRMCYPSPPSTLVIPDFSLSYALLLLRYFEITGDRPTIEQNLHNAERGITALHRHENAAGLLADVPGWIFLDNTFELAKFPCSAALNAVYHGSHLALAALFRACGQPERANDCTARASRLRATFRAAFLRPDRILDADSTPSHEAFHHWVYHFSADSGQWAGQSFRLRTSFRLENSHDFLRLAVHAGARVWIDGQLVANIDRGGSWARSAIYQPQNLQTPADAQWHRLDLEIQFSDIDWECYLSCAGNVEWAPALVWSERCFGECLPDAPPPAAAYITTLRHHQLPWMSQITVGHAAFHGLLEPDEARHFLRACLPSRYTFPFAKHTTPFFAVIDDTPDSRRILPCNVPASMYYFCHALARHGMAREARDLLLPIYRGMLERGATTWWEEWNTRSSHCHAWACFVIEFLDDAVTSSS